MKGSYPLVSIALILFFNLTVLKAQISRNTQLSLITCGPGEELYSSFGHSAIWFYDTSTGLDRIYNYGTFDFNTPNFYSKFVQGRLPYALDVSDMNSFMQTYYHEQRLVTQQILDLDSTQKKKIFDFLEINLLPQNKYYHYDFFYDNCSTRLRDLLEKCTNNSVKWHNDDKIKITMRQLLNPGVKNMPWTTFGFYLTLGNVTDIKATARSKMFLPEHLYNAINDAQLNNKPLVIVTKPVFVPVYPINTTPSPISPFVVFAFLLLAFVAITIIELKTKKHFPLLDHFLFGSIGVFGIFLTWLWFGTDHQATKVNLNILWALPTFILFPIIQQNNKTKKFMLGLLWFSVIMVTLVLISSNLIQEFHIVSRIIMLIVLVRLVKMLFINYKKAI